VPHHRGWYDEFSDRVAFVTFMIFWAWLDGTPPALKGISRLASVTIVVALVVQFVYGGLIYLLLTRTGLWRLWAVTLPYLLLWTVAWFAIDTFREAWGMIAWLAFGLGVLVCRFGLEQRGRAGTFFISAVRLQAFHAHAAGGIAPLSAIDQTLSVPIDLDSRN
jgi:hypothetical protein